VVCVREIERARARERERACIRVCVSTITGNLQMTRLGIAGSPSKRMMRKREQKENKERAKRKQREREG